jgi:predicted nucleic acid-binding Zn ribbon protein
MPRSRRSPRPLAIALERSRATWAPASLLGEVQAAWEQAVGGVVAAEATPTAERGGVVTIACSGAVWAQELDLMGVTIVERLNGLVSSGEVRRIRCVSTPRPR